MNLLKKTVNRDLILSGNMVQAIMSIAIPVVINSFLQTMYNLTDTFWLGKIGTEQLAAINLVTPVQSIIMNFGSGITVAGSVLIAQYIGAKDDENAKSMANQIFACAMILRLCMCRTVLSLHSCYRQMARSRWKYIKIRTDLSTDCSSGYAASVYN